MSDAPLTGPFWIVPVEMVVGLASNLMRAHITARRAGRDAIRPHATVFRRGGHLWAVIDFASGQSLQLRLSVPLTENA